MDEVMTYFTTQSLALPRHNGCAAGSRAGLFTGSSMCTAKRAPPIPGQALLAIPWYLAGRYGLMRLPGVPSEAHDP